MHPDRRTHSEAELTAQCKDNVGRLVVRYKTKEMTHTHTHICTDVHPGSQGTHKEPHR